VLPGLLSRFLESWPGVEVHITPALEPRHLLVGVERGELDLAFVNLPLPPGPFLTRHLFDDPYVFVTSTASELARRHYVSLEDIARLPLIGWRADADHAQIVDLFTGYRTGPDSRIGSTTTRPCRAAWRPVWRTRSCRGSPSTRGTPAHGWCP
jgi:DNA-binding transcriptional LysR family regulator